MRNSEVHDEELPPTLRRLDLAASCWIGGIAAHCNFMLWARAVQRETTQRAPSARKEQFTGGHAAVQKWLRYTQANTVRPHNARS